MIIVTGATGQLGGQTVERLLERVPASELAVSVRTPDKAAGLAERGVRVRAGDYADPASMEHSLEGAQTVLLVSGSTLGEDGVRQHGAVIDAAKRAGAERVVYTSHQAAAPGSRFAPCWDHAATEQLLADSGLRWTSLRDGFHANSVGFWLAMARDGVLRLPEDGPVSWTTHADLAEAAALTLLNDTLADGPTPPLTGPEALDAAAVAERAGELSGTAYRREVVGDDEFVAGMLEHGTPAPMAQMLLTMFLASRAGEFDVVDPYLPTLLGRPAMSIDSLVTASVSGGASSA